MKKLVITIAILIVSGVSLASAEYSSELQGAYEYAYSVGITTMPNIDQANMHGNLIRSHMAKMMVNYAINILGKTPDTSIPCNFADIANESEDMQIYIRQSCQLGLMGIGITKFDPSGKVTRAQFGTVLSRALRWNINDGGNPYYLYHFQTLKEAGIMNNLDPNMVEVRGYVMLMMMRAGGNIENMLEQCNVPETQILCMIGSTSCPAECQSDNITTNAGTLNISSTTIDPGTLPANSTYIGSLRFAATESNISLKSLTFQKIWSFTKGRIEDDGVTIASIQTLSTDSSTTVTFSPSVTIIQGEPKILSIFIENDGASDQGLNFSNSQSISSSANSVGGEFPLRLAE